MCSHILNDNRKITINNSDYDDGEEDNTIENNNNNTDYDDGDEDNTIEIHNTNNKQ